MRLLKYAGFMAALAGGLLSASAFSLLGPVNEAYQVPEIGYDLPGDIGAPKNIGEEYRWNTPVNYYAFDQSFIEYFGTNGIKEVESAFALFNALTNSGYSKLDLSQFPLESTRVNPRAQDMFLLDLKTCTVGTIAEELGLAEPDRYVWTLRSRYAQDGLSCPFMIYYVIMRNFDPFTFTPTPYINGVLYTYQVEEICTGSNPLGWTATFPVDPTTGNHLPVASQAWDWGTYVVALSRDDVGGLKYLYRTNNVNWETLSLDSEQFTANRGQAQLVFSSNMWTFAQAAMTNNAASLEALYPGLVVTGTTNIYTNIWAEDIFAYFTNAPWQPVDAFPQLVIETNRTLTVQTHYIHTFANVYTATTTNGQPQLIQLTSIPTNHSKIRVEVQTIATTNSPWMPIETVVVRQDTSYVYSNGIAGDFFILPTNACSVELISLQATLTSRVTNSLLVATNTITYTSSDSNNVSTTNYFAQNTVTTEKDRVWLVYPIECGTTNSTATLRQGIDCLQFRRASYDSLIGQFFVPITNYYTSVEITNSQTIVREVRRVIRQPDFLFSTVDMVNVKDAPAMHRNPAFSSNSVASALAGPGTIDPNIGIGYNRVGPMLINIYRPSVATKGLGHAYGMTNFVWASFDGSTNAPVIYPTGFTPGDVEDILLFQILSSELPAGKIGKSYSFQLEASGGEKPYSWAPSAVSAPLPLGLTLLSSGLITGTPTEPGDFSISVTLTEAGARTTTRTVTLHINP